MNVSSWRQQHVWSTGVRWPPCMTSCWRGHDMARPLTQRLTYSTDGVASSIVDHLDDISASSSQYTPTTDHHKPATDRATWMGVIIGCPRASSLRWTSDGSEQTATSSQHGSTMLWCWCSGIPVQITKYFRRLQLLSVWNSLPRSPKDTVLLYHYLVFRITNGVHSILHSSSARVSFNGASELAT